MSTDKANIWEELRKPFPKEVIGQLPKAGIKLDYVGHAAVTDRLLTVDPEWTWEPLAIREDGLPQYDKAGGLWIKLTINGVTRLGYGDGANPKEIIGDAIRNAAMRFGVALDLWSKDELESTLEHPELKNDKPSQRPVSVPIDTRPVQTESVTKTQLASMFATMKGKGYHDKDEATTILRNMGNVDSLTTLTKAAASELIKQLNTADKDLLDTFLGDEEVAA